MKGKGRLAGKAAAKQARKMSKKGGASPGVSCHQVIGLGARKGGNSGLPWLENGVLPAFQSMP